jgi:predicted O-methyltransferase YrrM
LDKIKDWLRTGADLLARLEIPGDLDTVLNAAWNAAKPIPGFLGESEARLLGTIAACAPRGGVILEIGSFKGKSTVMLGKVAAHYKLGPVVAIDPHNFNNAELEAHRTSPEASSYTEFLHNLSASGVGNLVEAHRAYSTEIAPRWTRPISFLWIDGDHSYSGAKSDFDGFARHLLPGGVVAFHDALHEFAGPIRVFVEDVLRSDRFGAAGFVQSIAWAQYRPDDGTQFRSQRTALDRIASRLIPLLSDNRELRGLRKLSFKIKRSRVPRGPMSPKIWAASLTTPDDWK